MLEFLAYIDPGTTALIWQILAGVLIVFGVVLGIWWTKVTTFVKGVWAKLFGKKKNNNALAEKDEAFDEISDETSGEISDETADEAADEIADKSVDKEA